MTGEHPGAGAAVQLNFGDLVAEGGDPLTRGGNAAASPPLREIVEGGRTISREVATSNVDCRGFEIHGRRWRQPGSRMREADTLACTGSEAQAAGEGGGL